MTDSMNHHSRLMNAFSDSPMSSVILILWLFYTHQHHRAHLVETVTFTSKLGTTTFDPFHSVWPKQLSRWPDHSDRWLTKQLFEQSTRLILGCVPIDRSVTLKYKWYKGSKDAHLIVYWVFLANISRTSKNSKAIYKQKMCVRVRSTIDLYTAC